MSPTMTEGGIASWKVKEGEKFSAGDVLLEIETDKATIDVEAQEDGIMGKILAPDGTKNVPVGKVIALLAEEGDDISNLEAPKEEAKPAQSTSSGGQTPPPSSVPDKASASPSVPPTRPPSDSSATHESSDRPLFPSVLRLLQENNIKSADIKGTGVRGMITKGDVLTYLGKASGPLGSFQAALDQEAQKAKDEKTVTKKPEAPPVLDGPAVRRLIVANMLEASQRKPAPGPVPTFDDIIADYLPSAPKPSTTTTPAPKPQSEVSDGLKGLY
ncbi:hypothetical protein EIP86_008098 [Pleurotus ostreatoroseus]|nr:hypothetical protein EIP86_008098 [Pleurotus ostreatoroseus]